MAYWERDALADIVSVLKQHMNIQCGLRVGVVRKGGPANASAWVNMPLLFPLFGTTEYRNLQLDVFVRKSVVAEWQFDTLIAGLSHELSHIVLESLQYEYRRAEEAVDITAILLGFRRFYLRGFYLQVESLVHSEQQRFGYLYEEEAQWVAQQF